MPIKTWVGRFSLVGGQPQEEGPFLRSFLRQRPDEEDDELYVMADPVSSGGEEYGSQLVDAIGGVYRQDTLSLTGAVQRALKAADQQLRDWNERSLQEHRLRAGVSCLAIRGRTAYVAQIGPTAAYRVEDGSFHPITPEDASQALGQTEQIQPSFSRYELNPGDLILLASPGIQEFLDEEALRSVLLLGADEALVELFRLARDQQDFSLVLLACVVEPEEATTDDRPSIVDLPQVGEEGARDQSTTPAATEALATEPPAPQPQEAAPAQPQDTEQQVPEPTTAQPQAPASEAAPPPAREVEPAATEAQPAEPDDIEAQEADAIVAEARAAEVGAVPGGLSQPRVRIKGEESTIRYPRTTGLRASLPNVPPVLPVAVLIVALVGLLAWCLIPGALEESRGDQYAGLITQASIALANAQISEDPGQQREDLRAANLALAEAEDLRPGDAEVASLRSQVAALETELDAIFELPPLDFIVDVSERLPGGISSKDLALGGGGAYFLDREQERVIVISLLGADPDPQALFQTDDLVGSIFAAAPQHIAWADELNALLILDGERRLISAQFGAPPLLLPLRDAEAWGSADGIAYANGNLYVLDRAGDQVWRYLPSESGFDSEREPLLASVELEGAVELALGDALYLVLEDDTILRFQGRLVVQSLSQAGIDVSLLSPASLVYLPDSDRLLLADRGNKRIVVLSPDGTFRQQLRSPTFSDLRAIAVDEPNSLVYILVGGALYRTTLPPTP